MSSDLNLVMTVVGFSFSVLFILFICTRLICARIHLSAATRSRARASDPSMLERGLHGLDPLVVANFPTLKYRELRPSFPEISQCVICLSEYGDEEEETLRALPICGHWFHKICIDKWLQQNSTCPVCRDCPPERRQQWSVQQRMFSPAVRYQQNDAHSYDHRQRADNRANKGIDEKVVDSHSNL